MATIRCKMVTIAQMFSFKWSLNRSSCWGCLNSLMQSISSAELRAVSGQMDPALLGRLLYYIISSSLSWAEIIRGYTFAVRPIRPVSSDKWEALTTTFFKLERKKLSLQGMRDTTRQLPTLTLNNKSERNLSNLASPPPSFPHLSRLVLLVIIILFATNPSILKRVIVHQTMLRELHFDLWTKRLKSISRFQVTDRITAPSPCLQLQQLQTESFRSKIENDDEQRYSGRKNFISWETTY